MRAMALLRPGSGRVEAIELPVPSPSTNQVLVRVLACGVCRTDLHVVDGELPGTRIPIVPGHEIVGQIDQVGSDVDTVAVGARVGIGWLASVCGQCDYCRSSRENLCRTARFTGHHVDGGYAEFVLADARFCYPLPENYDDRHAAPLLCAGIIGYRALRIAGESQRLGIYGFGAAAHIVAQVARQQGREVFAFVRPEDELAQAVRSRHGRDVGRLVESGAAGGTGCGRDFRTGWRTGGGGAVTRVSRRARGVRRHPHERYPVVCLSPVVGRAQPSLGGESHAGRRDRISGAGGHHAHPDACAAVRARRRESGADRPAIRHAHWRCGAVSVGKWTTSTAQGARRNTLVDTLPFTSRFEAAPTVRSDDDDL